MKRDRITRKRSGQILLFITALTSAACLLAGCTRSAVHSRDSGSEAASPEAGDGTISTVEDSGYYFDTTISIKLTAEHAQQLLDGCFSLCDALENTLSAQKETSELYQLNHRSEQTVSISEDLADCIRTGLYWSEKTDGAFDITIYPVSSLWDFHAEDPQVPDSDSVREALKKVDYRNVSLDGDTIAFSSPDTQIDLGGVAKGYISKKLKQYLSDAGCTSALINLGGNVSTLGKREDGESWTVGVQLPFSDRGEILAAVQSSDNCVISSGIYERYFEKDGVFYHHILDPRTGYPADTDLNQATVIGTDDADCDALATVFILLGKEKSKSFCEEENLTETLLFTDRENQPEWYPAVPDTALSVS